MAWIESHQSLRDHRKLLALEATLGVDRVRLVGHLHYFWWWALDNASPDGVLTGVTDNQIAEAARWPQRNRQKFVESLVTTGFLDRNSRETRVHNWSSFAGKWVERRRKHAQVMRSWRDASRGESRGMSRDNSTNQPTVPPNPPLARGNPPNPPAALHNVSGNEGYWERGEDGEARFVPPSKTANPPGAVPEPAPVSPPPDAGSGAVDPALGEVVRAYEQATKRPISPSAAVRLGELCAEHTPANVARAIERVAQRGDAVRMRTPAYLVPVLREMAKAEESEGYAPHGRIDPNAGYAPRGRDDPTAGYSVR